MSSRRYISVVQSLNCTVRNLGSGILLSGFLPLMDSGSER